MKRSSADQSGTMTARPSRGRRRRGIRAPAETRRPEPSMVSSRPARRLSRRPSRATSQMQAPLDPVEFADQRDGVAHQRLRVAVFAAPARRAARPPPAGRASAAGRSRRSCARRCRRGRRARPARRPRRARAPPRRASRRPARRAVIHPVLDRRGCRGCRARRGFPPRAPACGPRDGPGRAHSPGSARKSSGREAEDLLDLGADVAPAAVLTELGGVDDHRQAVEQIGRSHPPRRRGDRGTSRTRLPGQLGILCSVGHCGPYRQRSPALDRMTR